MTRYCKTSDLVDAVQWSGSNWHEQLAFAGRDHVAPGSEHTLIVTNEDEKAAASPGDWVVKDAAGRIFMVEQTAFASDYQTLDLESLGSD